jgi:hypothetical protein
LAAAGLGAGNVTAQTVHHSHMVGHGKTEIGRNPSDPDDTNFPGGLGCLRRKVNTDPANYGHLVNGDGSWKVRGGDRCGGATATSTPPAP